MNFSSLDFGPALMRRTSSGGMLPFMSPNPTLSKPFWSYFAIADERSAMMSTWIFFSTGFGDPHQLSTGTKSSDCLGVRALIL